MTLREGENAGNWKIKNETALCGELALQEAKDLSYDRIRNEWA